MSKKKKNQPYFIFTRNCGILLDLGHIVSRTMHNEKRQFVRTIFKQEYPLEWAKEEYELTEEERKRFVDEHNYCLREKIKFFNALHPEGKIEPYEEDFTTIYNRFIEESKESKYLI